MTRPTAALLAASALAAALPAAIRAGIIDQGSFQIHRRDRALGAETFVFEEAQDSLVVRARQYLTVPTAQGDEPLEKGADLLLGRSDYGLRHYQSNRKFRGETTIRALVVADTHYIAFREGDRGVGEGESRVLPPGRLFVMDSQVMTLLDLVCRSLHGKDFESRPITLLALGPRDTLLDARVVSRGSETIRWGAKPVVTRKLDIVADTRTTFTAWVGPQGQMLRLIEPTSGLRVEREPPPVKRRGRSTPPKPGG